MESSCQMCFMFMPTVDSLNRMINPLPRPLEFTGLLPRILACGVIASSEVQPTAWLCWKFQSTATDSEGGYFSSVTFQILNHGNPNLKFTLEARRHEGVGCQKQLYKERSSSLCFSFVSYSHRLAVCPPLCHVSHSHFALSS